MNRRKDLQARLKRRRILLDHELAPGQLCRPAGFDLRCGGNGLSFVETSHGESELIARIAAFFTGVQRVEVEPVALRSMFARLPGAACKGEFA